NQGGDKKRAEVIQKVGDFYKSAMDTNRLESLGFKPLKADLKRIDSVKSREELLRLLAEFHERGVGGFFGAGVSPDAKNSEVYAFELGQGGLGLPDRDYYLSDGFTKQRDAYVVHITKMFTLLGEKPEEAKAHAATILDVETALAKASKSRVDLRDPVANNHKATTASLAENYPDLPLKFYMMESGLEKVPDLIVGQPEFFAALDKLVRTGRWRIGRFICAGIWSLRPRPFCRRRRRTKILLFTARYCAGSPPRNRAGSAPRK